MTDLPLLLPVQQDLLATMIESEGRVPPDQRQEFLAFSYNGDNGEETQLRHPGLNGNPTLIFSGDLRVLADKNLILLRQPKSGAYVALLLPAAYLYYGLTRRSDLPEVCAAVRGVLAGALDQAQRELRIRERTNATFGVHVPTHVAFELEAKREEVLRLEQRLKDFDGDALPSPD